MAQMPEESRKFGIVDTYWKDIMTEAVKDTDCLVATSQPRMLDRLLEANQLLDEIQKGLNAYLEKKRLYFPRSDIPPSSYPVLSIFLLQTTLVHVMSDVIHHLTVGLPFARVPLTSIIVARFTLFPSPICRMCPYQHNLAWLIFNAMFSTPKFLLILSLLSLFLSVTPFIRLNILITVTSNSLSSLLLGIHTSAKYTMSAFVS